MNQQNGDTKISDGRQGKKRAETQSPKRTRAVLCPAGGPRTVQKTKKRAEAKREIPKIKKKGTKTKMKTKWRIG